MRIKDIPFYNRPDYRMKKDKLKREKQANCKITWDDYVKLLFGFAVYLK